MSQSDQQPIDATHAWRDIPRADSCHRSVEERIADFLEIYTTLDEETAREQAIRCVQCPHPTCVEGCPLGNRIPDWMALTAEGHFLEAAELLQSSGCLSDFFSRICTDPCEPTCIVGAPGESVAINAVERFLHHYAATQGHHRVVRPAPNGFRVAVLDSGPCGLACAHDLASDGCAVTVLDHHLLPGGLLVNGIPAFKVERTVVQQQMQYLGKLGVQFRLGLKSGRDFTLHGLLSDYDAVFVGDCAEEAVPLTLPGANLQGVYQGLTYLIQKNIPSALDLTPIDVQGRRVVVLGAGDTAMDCLRTAIRCGAREPLCLYRRDAASVPADPHEYRNAVEEGARFEFMALPIELIGDPAHQVTHVRCLRTRVEAAGNAGLPDTATIPESQFDVPADVVFVAFGYSAAPFPREGDFAEIAADESGRIRVDASLMTSVPGVFAGGTLVRGRIPVVETVRDARQAARSIRQFLAARPPSGKPA